MFALAGMRLRPVLPPAERPVARAQVSKKQPCIVTFCRGIDTLLGGGMPTGEVTEVVGVPGVGKTQLCTQLAVDASLPKAFGGVDGQTLYIDTEGSFTPDRCAQMADALSAHVRGMAARQSSATAAAAAAAFTTEFQMARIHVVRCTSLAEQMATILGVQGVVKAVEAGPGGGDAAASAPAGSGADAGAAAAAAAAAAPVRLVIVDSIAFHYRGDASSADAGQRSRQLAAQAQALHSLAATRGIAVVVVNHVTTKLGGRGDAWGSGNGGGIGAGAASEAAEAAGLLGDGSAAASAAAAAAMAGSGDSLGAGSQLAPALGDSWAHACTNRLFLYWFGKVRVARLAKSPSRPLGAAAFAVTSEGVRRPPAEGSA